VESRFRGDVSLDSVARELELSRFHVSRLFSMVVGMPFSAYLRGRRLSEAAKILADGKTDILAVALDAGYTSHEAFTRAFSDQFGVTPDRVRKAKSVTNLKLLEAIRMSAKIDRPGHAPVRIETLSMTLVGSCETYRMSDNGGIPDQWQRFVPFLLTLDGRNKRGTFGVIMEASNGDPESFDYLCAVEKLADIEIPKGFKTLKTGELKIARFPHEGHVSKIQATCHDVFTRGLPEAGLKMAGPISFLEYYGPDFNGMTGYGTVEIWVNVSD
jgi:AraC family transcriptional regulator